MQPGFVFYDEGRDEWPSGSALKSFLESGDPPLVFTLGSTAVSHPGRFYETSIEAIRRLSTRAVLIGAGREVEWITPGILSLPYAPYSEVFPAASVIVHQGGSGTTAQALRAGRPMLFVPWGWDQPDNGTRVERRGAALCIPKDQYSTDTALRALDRLRGDESFAYNAAAAAGHIKNEGGLRAAADNIEGLLRGK